MRLLLDSTAEAIYGVDLEGNCTFANSACLRMLGYSDPRAVIGKNMHALTHHTRAGRDSLSRPGVPDLPTVSKRARRVTADDEVLWRADGSSFPAECWAHPMRHDGKIVGSVVAFLDITERKAAEEELIRAKELAEAASWRRAVFWRI